MSSPSESSHNKTAIILTVLCPPAAVRCSLQLLSADRMMPASVTRSPSVNFKNVFLLSISCNWGSSASLKALSSENPQCVTGLAPGHGSSANARNRHSPQAKYCVLHTTSSVWKKTTFNSERKEMKILATFYLLRSWKISYIAEYWVLKFYIKFYMKSVVNPLNAELNPVSQLLALCGAHHISHFSDLRVNLEVNFDTKTIERKRTRLAEFP